MADKPYQQDASTGTEPSDADGFFNVIDESGEGFGFDLTPENLFRPILIGTASLFGVGMLTGIPIGIAMGRSSEESNTRTTTIASKQGTKPPPRASFEGLKFAATTFGLGSLLCASMGVAGFYAVKTYYGVDSFEQFGHIMRSDVVPNRRKQMEDRLLPLLRSVRQTAGDTLPGPVRRLQKRFEGSRFGRWIKKQVDESVNIIPDIQDGNSETIQHDSSGASDENNISR